MNVLAYLDYERSYDRNTVIVLATVPAMLKSGCCEIDRNKPFRFGLIFRNKIQVQFRFDLSENFEKRGQRSNFFGKFRTFQKFRKNTKFSEPKRYFEKFRNTLVKIARVR